MQAQPPPPSLASKVTFLDLKMRVYPSAEAHGGDHAGAGYLNESLARIENDQARLAARWALVAHRRCWAQQVAGARRLHAGWRCAHTPSLLPAES